MSNNIIEKDLATTAKNVKETTIKLHAKAINTSETLIEETMAVSEEWQGLMGKALHAGVDIFAKQQDLTLTTLEAVKAQYLSGNDRMVKLLGLQDFDFNQWTNTFFNKAKKASATAANKVSKTILTAEEKRKSEAIKEIVENNKIEANATPTVAKVAKKAAKTAKVATKKTAKATTAKAKKGAEATMATAKETAKVAKTKVVKKTAKAAKETTKAAENVAKETATKVEKIAKETTPKVKTDKLTIIEGIGPKAQEVLNNAGILSFQELSLKTAKELENILITADPRYKRFEPTTWAAQAKFAAEGKMEELTAWQDELKGGVIAK